MCYYHSSPAAHKLLFYPYFFIMHCILVYQVLHCNCNKVCVCVCVCVCVVVVVVRGQSKEDKHEDTETMTEFLECSC